MSVHAHTSKLDIERFAKVRRLMEGGATEGERAAARARAEAMAKAAGMTLAQALSKVDSKPDAQPAAASSDWRNIFTGFDDWMEEREPGYKAKQAAKKAGEEAWRAMERARVLDEFGSEEAVFAETEHERLLREALAPLADYSEYHGGGGSYVSGFAGWTTGKPNDRLWAALERAYPFPGDLAGVWGEFLGWQELDQNRYAFDQNGEHPIHVRARIFALEHLLDTMPAPTWEGMRARIGWLSHCANLEYSRDIKEDRALARSLWQDFESLYHAVKNGQTPHTEAGASKPPLHRTNADKRRDVLSILDAEPELSDREIARRCGVSPQTVGNWRRRFASSSPK